MNQPLDHNALQMIRTAPQNQEIEQQLLGAILVNNEAFYRVSDFLKVEHFFVEPHRRIYETAEKLIRAGKIATPLTVKTFFSARGADGRPLGHRVPRPPRRQRHHHHQRRGLRPHAVRPVAPPRADLHRRGHGQRGVRRAARAHPAHPDRRRRAPPLRARRDRPLRPGLHRLQRRAAGRGRHGGGRA